MSLRQMWTVPTGTIVMATNAEFPPYEYHEGDEIVGLDADFSQAIADRLGMELKIEDYGVLTLSFPQ